MEILDDLRYALDHYESAPDFARMPRRTLGDKGQAGPTGAHCIEEVFTPFNLAYLSMTTGSTAFQNITGVTHNELPSRVRAGEKALALAGIGAKDRLLFTYPPLVGVFGKDALAGRDWFFLERSCRDALLWALCREKPKAVVGESSFLRAALQDALALNLPLPTDTVFLAAGTPLDLALPALVSERGLGTVHDLYGCQEFGWLAFDGFALRDDISLIPCPEKAGYFHFAAGGLATGDCFPVSDNGHILGGRIVTHARRRTKAEPEGTVTDTTARSADTVYSLAKTILRIKGKIIRVSPDLTVGAEATKIVYPSASGKVFEIAGPDKTALFDALLQAQMQYQSRDKRDAVWNKGHA